MSTKAIIEVELHDGEWKKFNESVKKHQEILGKMPGQWGAVGSSIGKVSDKAAKMVANAKHVKDSFSQAKTITDKFVIGLQAADRTISSLVRGSYSLAKNIASVTTSILKWGAGIAISGILSLGGLFATFGSMGKDIASTRSSALQTGSTYGQQIAAKNVYGVYGVDANEMMGMISKDIHSGNRLMRRAQLNPDQINGKESGDILPLYLKSMHDMYQKFMAEDKENGTRIVDLKMKGFFPNQDENMMRQIGHENISSLNDVYYSQSKAQDMKRGEQDRYTKFASDWDSVWDNAKKKLADAFHPLLDPMTKLSDSLLTTFGRILGDPNTQAGIVHAGAWMESTAKWLATKEGQQAIADGIEGVARFAKAVYDVAMFVESLIPEKKTIEDIKMKGGAALSANRTTGNAIAWPIQKAAEGAAALTMQFQKFQKNAQSTWLGNLATNSSNQQYNQMIGVDITINSPPGVPVSYSANK